MNCAFEIGMLGEFVSTLKRRFLFNFSYLTQCVSVIWQYGDADRIQWEIS